jgi:two-component system, cell cycle sensor histidine kinase and response regulator CckA
MAPGSGKLWAMAEIHNAKTTILIAEDDAEVRKFVTTILQDRGFSVIAAPDAKQALTRARNHLGEITILLTDVEMGKLDGFDLRERLLQERPNVKVVVMSGRLDDDFVARDFPVIRKPFSPAELLKAIESQL